MPKSFEGLNTTDLRGLMSISSPVWGLRPRRSRFWRITNVPKPVIWSVVLASSRCQAAFPLARAMTDRAAPQQDGDDIVLRPGRPRVLPGSVPAGALFNPAPDDFPFCFVEPILLAGWHEPIPDLLIEQALLGLPRHHDDAGLTALQNAGQGP